MIYSAHTLLLYRPQRLEKITHGCKNNPNWKQHFYHSDTANFAF
jgi:hypothetical protein